MQLQNSQKIVERETKQKEIPVDGDFIEGSKVWMRNC